MSGRSRVSPSSSSFFFFSHLCACAEKPSSTSPVGGFSGWSDAVWLPPWLHCIVKRTVNPSRRGAGVQKNRTNERKKDKPSRLGTHTRRRDAFNVSHPDRFNKLTFFKLIYFIPCSFMVYAPGEQKWRPTCTGSEVCIPMWTFHHTHSSTHTNPLFRSHPAACVCRCMAARIVFVSHKRRALNSARSWRWSHDGLQLGRWEFAPNIWERKWVRPALASAVATVVSRQRC